MRRGPSGSYNAGWTCVDAPGSDPQYCCNDAARCDEGPDQEDHHRLDRNHAHREGAGMTVLEVGFTALIGVVGPQCRMTRFQ